MTTYLLNGDGAAVGAWVPAGPIAETVIKPHLIHETVIAELAWRRAGTHATRNRALIHGGGRKPWRQKGTGRARQGSNRAPQWTGGAITFGPQPRSYGGKVNKKIRAQAFRAALRAHVERGTVAILEPTGWEAPSAKRASALAAALPEAMSPRPLLVVVADLAGVDALSFRNLRDTYVLAASELETVDVMAGRSLLVERSVWERWCGGEIQVEAVAAPPKKATRKKAAPAVEPEAPAAVSEEPPAPAEEPPAKKPRTRKKAEEPAAAAEPAEAQAAAEEAPAEESPVEEPAADADASAADATPAETTDEEAS